MDCAETDGLLAARLDGTLEVSQAADLDVHLGNCADCRALVAMLEPVFPVVDDAVYDLGPVVAIGGMGQIRLARDLRTGREVAIKELMVQSELMIARFVREARVAANLQHPNIVPIYDVGTWSDGTPFYTMRPVKGRTLHKALITARTLGERLELLPSIVAVSDALAFAHSTGVIHRDLTPGNVLLGEFGETIVIDWGLAKGHYISEHGAKFKTGLTEQVLTARGDVIGSPAYMPREQAEGEALDTRADIYSLGAILYHVLAGHAPYAGKGARETLAQVRREAPPPIERIARGAPRHLVRIVAKAMSRDPQERHATMLELGRELRGLTAARPWGAWLSRLVA